MNSAIVGCGGIAHVHADALRQMDGVNLCAFADIKPERAEEFVTQFGNENSHAYQSFEEMLEKEQIDVLHICTPHYLHVPMAIAALEKGINVFMEKPPALSMDQLSELDRVKGNAALGVCFQNRYNASVRQVKSLLDSGEAGKVLGARAFVTWHREAPYYTESGWRGSIATEGGGVLINQSIHTLDLLKHFLGMPEKIEGTVINHHLKGVIEVEDTAEAYLLYPDKVALFYATTAFCTDSPVMVELVCEKMTIRMEETKLTITEKGKPSKEMDFSVPANSVGKAYWGNGHMACIADYYDCLRNNRRFPVTIESAGETLRLMRGIYESYNRKAPVVL